MTINDELSALQPASFDGIRFPVTSRRHEVRPHTFESFIVYRDGEYVEIMGQSGRIFSYVVPMRSGISTAGYWRQFEKVYALFDSYRKPEARTLVDPVWGEILATPGAWSDELDAQIRDGVNVSLTFKEHTPIGESIDQRPPTLQTVEDEAASLDDEVSVTPWTVQAPAPSGSATDPLSAAAALINQVNYTRDRFNANILSVSSHALKVERAAEKLGVEGEPARKAARKLRIDSERLATAPPREKAGVVVQVVESAPKTISQLAAEIGITVEELLRLDANLARSVLTPAGYRVWSKGKQRGG